MILLVVIVINVLEHLVMTVIQVVSRTDVEPTVYRVTVLHFSGGQAWVFRLVSWLVSWCEFFRDNRSKDFLAFLHECSLL